MPNIKITEVAPSDPFIKTLSGNVFYQGHVIYSMSEGTTRYGSEILAAAELIKRAAIQNGHVELFDALARLRNELS
jgi:hypothetical protein